MNLRILVVENEAEQIQFLGEVLAEMDSGAYWSEWVHVEPLFAASWNDAVGILDRESVDAILLNPQIEGHRSPELFRRFQALAGHIPIVLMVDEADAASMERLLRDGAQDFLIRKDIDCAPLAHAVRNARERHRLLTALRADAMTDSLTGLMNRRAFLGQADRDRILAKRLNSRMSLLLAEVGNSTEPSSSLAQQRRDLRWIEAADHLRTLTGPADLVAHLGEGRFGIAVMETDSESAEETWTRMRGAAALHKMNFGMAIFDPDRPVSLEELMDQAARDLTPQVFGVGR